MSDRAPERPRLCLLDSVARIRQEAPRWDSLWQRSDATMPTCRAELVAQWLEHFAPRARALALVVEQDGQAVAALPLAGRRVRGVLPVGDLTANCWAANADFLLDPACDVPAVCDLLADQLARLPWPLAWFDLTIVDSPRWESLRAAAARRGLEVDVRPHYSVGLIDIAGPYADYEGRLSANLRRSLRKDLRRLEQQGTVSWRTLGEFAPDEVGEPLNAAFELEARGWKWAAGGTVLGKPGMAEFYGRLCRQLAQWNSLRISFLEHAGRPIAFELGWTAKQVYHSFKVGYDPQFSAYGPGHLLRRFLIESFHAGSEVRTVDFSGPLTDALTQWSTRSYRVARVTLVPRRSTSRACWLGYRLSAPVLRFARRSQD